ncbi:MAG: hypothetical protein ACRDLB_00390 [Actinomycetota bacterium]
MNEATPERRENDRIGARWLSAADAADAAGVTPGAVRTWAEKGYIVSQRSQGLAGEQMLVRLDEVMAHVGASPPPAETGTGDADVDSSGEPSMTNSLAPLLKAVPDLMTQLTAATDRAARAETKLEFLSGQVTTLREQLKEVRARNKSLLESLRETRRDAGFARPLDTTAGGEDSRNWAIYRGSVEERPPPPQRTAAQATAGPADAGRAVPPQSPAPPRGPAPPPDEPSGQGPGQSPIWNSAREGGVARGPGRPDGPLPPIPSPLVSPPRRRWWHRRH